MRIGLNQLTCGMNNFKTLPFSFEFHVEMAAQNWACCVHPEIAKQTSSPTANALDCISITSNFFFIISVQHVGKSCCVVLLPHYLLGNLRLHMLNEKSSLLMSSLDEVSRCVITNCVQGKQYDATNVPRSTVCIIQRDFFTTTRH